MIAIWSAVGPRAMHVEHQAGVLKAEDIFEEKSGLPVLQRSGDHRVPGSTVNTVAFQPKDGPCTAQQIVMRVRLGKRFMAERIHR